MLPAFGSLAFSILGVQHGLRDFGAPSGLRVILVVAAVGMLAAGLWTTDRSLGLHVAAVMLGFTPLVLAMYLLPARVGRLRSRAIVLASALFGAGAVLDIASANFGVPLGVAQRISAASVLCWLCALSCKLQSTGADPHVFRPVGV